MVSRPSRVAASPGVEICRPNPKKAEFTNCRVLAVMAGSLAMVSSMAFTDTSGELIFSTTSR